MTPPLLPSKILLEAALLTPAGDQELSELFQKGMDEIVKARKTFPEASLGRSEKLDYILSLSDKTERLHKLWAFSNGLDFVKWKLGVVPEMDPVEGLRKLFADCVMKSREGIYVSASAEEAKEAAKWTTLAVQIGRLLKSWIVDGNSAMLDLQIALKHVGVDELPSLSDIL